MIKAKKKFGQNFLNDQTVIKEILNYLKPLENDKILEIGPGMGAITIPLLNKLNHISVIEIDPDMINYLQKKIPGEKINIINHDVLSINNKDLEVYDRIIGNLPYYISTEILIKMIDIFGSLKDIHFMFQKEVAERITAKPRSKNFGRLSVLIQYFFDSEILFDISANSFSPPPKIQSSFIKLIPRKKEGMKFKNLINFKKVNPFPILGRVPKQMINRYFFSQLVIVEYIKFKTCSSRLRNMNEQCIEIITFR